MFYGNLQLFLVLGVFRVFFLAVNWHTPSVHMLLMLPVWSDQSIFFPQDFPVCCSVPHSQGFCSMEMLSESCPFFPKCCSRICAGLWIKVSCALAAQLAVASVPGKEEQCRRSVSRGCSWGNPRDCLTVAARGNLVQQHMRILSVTVSCCKACGQRWAVWDIGQLRCSALLYSRKKGEKRVITVCM